jgi:hypothetical protein
MSVPQKQPARAFTYSTYQPHHHHGGNPDETGLIVTESKKFHIGSQLSVNFAEGRNRYPAAHRMLGLM